MEVFGHDYVSDDYEFVTLAHRFDHGEQEVTVFGFVEQGAALVAATSDEVEASCVVVAVEAPGHVDTVMRDGLVVFDV